MPKPRRFAARFADYVATGVCLLLVIGLAESFNLFLFEICYVGPDRAYLRWNLFWFLFGAVLATRLALEQGRAAAYFYGAILVLLLLIMVGPVWAVWVALTLTWWAAARLVRKANRIEEALPEIGWLEPDPDELRGPRRPRDGSRLFFLGLFAAALAVFGLGEWRLRTPAQKLEQLAYVTLFSFCGLGFLLALNFLQVRAYLQTFGVRMPKNISRRWLARGLKWLTWPMAAALLLPRPGAVEQWKELLRWAAARRSAEAAPGGVAANFAHQNVWDLPAGAQYLGDALALALAALLGVRFGPIFWRRLRTGIRSRGRRRQQARILEALRQQEIRAATSAVRRPVAFEDPFHSGLADASRPGEVLAYSLAAAESAAARYGTARHPGETWLEFFERVRQPMPILAQMAAPLVDVYLRVEFGGGSSPPKQWRETAAEFWERFAIFKSEIGAAEAEAKRE